MSHVSRSRILFVGLGFGLVSNVLGWVGNRVLLRDYWERANAAVQMPFELPYPHWVREAISLSFDFILCLGWVWIFAQFRRRTISGSVSLAFTYWIMTVGVLYVVLANSSVLPWDVAMFSALVGLAIWLPMSLVLPALLPSGDS